MALLVAPELTPEEVASLAATARGALPASDPPIRPVLELLREALALPVGATDAAATR